jgi:DNA-binding CsgD family transcriptional regulator
VPAILGASVALQGDLLRLLGDLPAAERAYEAAMALGDEPQPGLSLLRLAQGDADAAASMIERVLAEADGAVFRARPLVAAVPILLAADRLDAARAAADELRAVAAELGSSMLTAEAAHAAGAVLLVEGSPTEALAELRRALRACMELGAAWPAPAIRLLVADTCEALGDGDGAAQHRAAAERALEEFRRPLASPSPPELPDGLTDREAEVLRLVAAGHTNRAIADRLYISEKTVGSHVAHIFTKLGVNSRAAATRYAFERQLV